VGNIRNLFDPKSVALIGATDKEGSLGAAMLANLLQTKGRKIFPVNPHKKTAMGIQCFESVSAIGKPVDLAVVTAPAREVPAIAEECGKAGVGGMIIISAGFRDAGEEGRELERRVSAVRKEYGMRILGPNCLGFVRPNAGLNATFMKAAPPPGDIAFISQSGALGSVVLDWAADAHVGFSMFASLGSMMDVSFGDLIDFLGDDDDTRSILLYMERVGDAKKFMSAARAFAMRKPIVVLKPARPFRSPGTRSHTGAMTTDEAVYEAVFKRVGVARVRETVDLFDAAQVLDSRRLPRGPKLAIVAAAGAQSLMAANALMNLGGEAATLSENSIERLNQHLPPRWSKGHPVNLRQDTDAAAYGTATETCLDDDGVDGVLVIYVPADAPPIDVARTVIERAKESEKPTITAWMGGSELRETREVFTQNSIPTYHTPEQAVRTYATMYRYKRNLELLYETPAELSVQEAPRKEHLLELIRQAVGEGRSILNEQESKAFLSSYDIPTATPYVTRHLGEATAIAQEIGYPVAIKIVSPDILDRSEIGGVVTWINSDEELAHAYERMIARVKERVPQLRIEGVSIQKMIEDIDYELILGAMKHKDFGAVILFGMGGIATELIGDFSIALPPLNQTLARRLMEETKAYKLIQGWRGKLPADLGELETIVVNFSNLVADFPEIAEFDINPLVVSGGKARALSARIILDPDCSKPHRPYSHLVIAPYPTRYVEQWKTSDGTEVLLRPIRPEDEALEHEFVSSLSAETLRTRFFTVLKNISHDWLVGFCNIDYDRHIAIVAEIKEGEQKKIVGVVRLVVQPDTNSGQFALVVHDNFRRRRLGKKLMQSMIKIGKDKELQEIWGDVLEDNDNMLDLCQGLGFNPGFPVNGTIKVTLKLG
jgi:acetyltransferase